MSQCQMSCHGKYDRPYTSHQCTNTAKFRAALPDETLEVCGVHAKKLLRYWDRGLERTNLARITPLGDRPVPQPGR